MKLSENIKRLRAERGITQEKLAERLNISPQAVSKWERGEALPDTAMIIPVASAFGVSTDELLGLDRAKNEEKIKAYINEDIRLRNAGRDKEAFALIKRAYEEFPHDWRIICKYIEKLCFDPDYMEKPWGAGAHYDELTRLCQRVIDECPQPQLRFNALDCLFCAYSWTGRKDMAVALGDYYPGSYYQTKKEAIINCYDGAEWAARQRETIWDLLDCLAPKIMNLAHGAPPEKQIEVYKKLLALIELLFEDKDFGHFAFYLGRTNCMIARCYLTLSDPETAAVHAERGLALLAESDGQWRRGEIITHTSFLTEGVTFNPRATSKSNKENWVAYELKQFDAVDLSLADGKFKAALEKYAPLAGFTE